MFNAENNTRISISGSSCAGKTTFINATKELLGDNVVVLKERIREMPLMQTKSIDEIRKSPDDYCQLQIDTLTAKYNDELEADKNNKGKLILTDRSSVDQLMYLSCYVDKTNLSDDMAKKFRIFYSHFYGIVKSQLGSYYDKIFFFNPILPSDADLDKFRSLKLHHFQYMESTTIKLMTQAILAEVGCSDKFVVYDNSTREVTIPKLIHHLTGDRS